MDNNDCQMTPNNAEKVADAKFDLLNGVNQTASFVLLDTGEKIPVHDVNDKHGITVGICAWGHKKYPFSLLYTPCPNAVGGVSVIIDTANFSGRTIKYLKVFATPLNAVGDPVICTVRNESTRCLSITGPIKDNADFSAAEFETVWFNPTIAKIEIDHAIAEYMDGTKEYFTKESLTQECELQKKHKENESRKSREKDSCALAMSAFTFAFIFPFAGLPMGICAYKKAKKDNSEKAKRKGKMAIIANAISLGIFALAVISTAFSTPTP